MASPWRYPWQVVRHQGVAVIAWCSHRSEVVAGWCARLRRDTARYHYDVRYVPPLRLTRAHVTVALPDEEG